MFGSKLRQPLPWPRIQDATILSTLLDWLHGEDEGLHNVAIEALRTLGTEEATATLVTSYEEQTGDDRDKVVLATALLRMGDSRGVEFLNSLGRRAKGMLSVSAATWLFLAGKVDRGLNLMLHILDRGDIEAKRGMVDQISPGPSLRTGSPRTAFTMLDFGCSVNWCPRTRLPSRFSDRRHSVNSTLQYASLINFVQLSIRT